MISIACRNMWFGMAIGVGCTAAVLSLGGPSAHTQAPAGQERPIPSDPVQLPNHH